MSNDWEGDKYHTPYYPLLSDQYLTVNDGILESLEKELFGDEEEVAEESEGLTVDEYLDKLEDEYLQ